MEETKHCPKCNTDYPKTTEFFYCWTPKYRRNVHQWNTYCRKCDSKRVSIMNMGKYVYKLHQPSPKEIIKQKLEASKTPTKICNVCGNELELAFENFYWIKRKQKFEGCCIECRNERTRIYRTTEEELTEFPGQFRNEEDRLAVKNLLENIGWKYAEDYKIWFKPNLKSKHNHWIFQKYER